MPPEKPCWRPSLLVLSCEHAGREVPPRWRARFRGYGSALRSHRGHDIGALPVALRLADRLSAPLLFTRVTRLLVDTNRSPGHPHVFGPPLAGLCAQERRQVLDTFHTPHRASVERLVGAAITAGHRVLHVGVHSFTDVLDEVMRELDLALLFDPQRCSELSIAQHWSSALHAAAPGWRHRLNEPYRGVDDGLTSTLRERFAVQAYAGLEVEIRQGLVLRAAGQGRVADLLATTLRSLLHDCGATAGQADAAR